MIALNFFGGSNYHNFGDKFLSDSWAMLFFPEQTLVKNKNHLTEMFTFFELLEVNSVAEFFEKVINFKNFESQKLLNYQHYTECYSKLKEWSDVTNSLTTVQQMCLANQANHSSINEDELVKVLIASSEDNEIIVSKFKSFYKTLYGRSENFVDDWEQLFKVYQSHPEWADNEDRELEISETGMFRCIYMLDGIYSYIRYMYYFVFSTLLKDSN